MKVEEALQTIELLKEFENTQIKEGKIQQYELESLNNGYDDYVTSVLVNEQGYLSSSRYYFFNLNERKIYDSSRKIVYE